MKKISIHLLLLVLLFIFMYTPRLFGDFSPLIILSSCAWLVLFTKFNCNFIKIAKVISVKRLILGLSFVILFLSFRTINTISLTSVYTYISLLVEVVPCSLMICFLLRRYSYSIDNLYSLLIQAGLLQFIFAGLMFFVPDVKSTILGILSNNGFDFTTDKLSFWVNYRIFGLATGYFFAMPILQGMLALIAVVMAIKKSYWYLFCVPLLLFSGMINARVCLFIFFFSLLVLLIFYCIHNKAKFIPKIFLIIVVVAAAIYFAIPLINIKSEFTSEWINDSFIETQSLIQRNESEQGYYQELKRMTKIPTGSELLYGYGFNIFYQNSLGISSDVGYVNDLYFGGIILIILLYPAIFQLYFTGWGGSIWDKSVILVITITLLIANIKGIAFSSNEFLNVSILISFAIYYLAGLSNQAQPNKNRLYARTASTLQRM